MSKTDEIDLIDLSRFIWSKRYFIIKVTCAFLVIGLILALTSKVEYKSSCKLLAESQEGGPNLGGLGGFAGLAGFDISSLGTAGGLSPELYPEIVGSTPFLNKTINTPIYFEKKDTTISSFNYFKELDEPSLLGLIKEYSIGLPGKIKALLSSSKDVKIKNYGLFRFSKDDWELIENYRNRLSVSLDELTGILSVSVEMPDPVAAASLTELLVDELTKSVSQYKIQKSQINLEFIQDRFTEAKQEYEAIQNKLANFSDRNRNVTNSVAQTEYERLQNELNIVFEVYKNLATQLEQAKIKVKEDTPVFTVLEPARVPEDKSKPRRRLIVVLSLVSGIFTGCFWVFIIFYKKTFL